MDHLDYVDHLDPKHQMRMVKFQNTIDVAPTPSPRSVWKVSSESDPHCS